MKKNIIVIAISALLAFGCSEDKETVINNETSTAKISAATGRVKGEIPPGLNVFTTLQKANTLTLADMLELYKQDISKSQGQDFDTNLKNIWFIKLNRKALNEGNEEQKMFLISQQMEMENNLPHFNSFYTLLLSVNSIDKTEKMNLSNRFKDKNIQVIREIKWHTPDEKKEKETELLLAQRNFGMQQQFSK
ncbi:hypothetical protein CHU92_13890 [Flavobacterium cyanobacteriorum]|uniref:Lipoprotein n=1 Tax=Flavobacterium cyanobacteriorum TaxID=2022802 RepID=A0A255YUV1_9FLAO|nr:hypothetical protein [Flavobacterium cyanobacteriorum]OYQ33007.1 hypothetical protein CHU92_13890 [Flavobacterium cyanobacteriorum]